MKAFFENKTYEDGIRINVWHGSNMNYLAHWHREVELGFVTNGEIRIGINNREKILSKGDFCIVASSDIHFYDSKQPDSFMIIVIFDPSFLGLRDLRLGTGAFANPFIERAMLEGIQTGLSDRIYACFESIAEEYDRRASYYEMFIKSKLTEIWAMALRHLPLASLDPGAKLKLLPYIDVIKKSIQFLEANYASSITLTDLAGNANLSPFYFSRLFKTISGLNFKEYLDTIRVDRADTLIRDHAGSIAQIALDCGFNSVRSFNRVYKAVRGIAPSKAR